jgi:2-polyprenyl-3-methyl-5-hydroxy-6-metoxy-1,4-benzoquinol methylase
MKIPTNEMVCTACDSNRVRFCNHLPDVTGALDLDDPGSLFYCKNCKLFFRYPYPCEEALTSHYQNLDSNIWVEKSSRRAEFVLAKNYIVKNLDTASILDVGCYTGIFLDSLPEKYERFGIESSVSTRKILESKKIKVIGGVVRDLERCNFEFNVITLFDVIEHLPSPVSELKLLLKMLKPGGRLLVSTGNTSSLAWRLNRKNFWYYYPEHVSFFSPSWFRYFCHSLNVKVDEIEKFSYSQKTNSWIVMKLLIKSFLEYVHMGFVNRFISGLRHTRLHRVVPDWNPDSRCTKDHILICLKKYG